MSIAPTQPLLGFPGNGLYRVRRLFRPPLKMGGLAGRKPIASRGFHQHSTDMAVAGLGDPPRRVVLPLEYSRGTNPR